MRQAVLFLSFLVCFAGSAHTFAACDQTFYGDLRYGWYYQFGDTWNNDTNKVGISGVNVDMSTTSNYSDDPAPHFNWTPQIIAQNYIVQP